MKVNVTHVITKTAKNGGNYYVFIAQSSFGSKAFTVFNNVSVIGADSIDHLVLAVSILEKGQHITVDFVSDQSNNIAVAIVE